MRKKLIIFLIPVLVLLGALISFWWPSSPAHHPDTSSQTKQLKILVTIKPLYSLVAGLTKDIPNVKPELLLSPPNSPHTFHLKPSDVDKIVKADLVIWVGPELENFLINPLHNLKSPSQTFGLIENTKLALLAVRQDEHWEPHNHEDHEDHDHHDHDHDHDHDHGTIDAHIWLNTDNAKQILLAISQKLQILDPIHAQDYINNQNRLIKKLDALKITITNNLKPIQHKPFLVFHDAYQYFEHEFGLTATGSITVNPQVPLSAKRLNHIQSLITHDNVQCVFSEPEFSQTLVHKLLQNTKAKNLELDPLGARIPIRPNQEEEVYFDLMMGLDSSFRSCLL